MQELSRILSHGKGEKEEQMVEVISSKNQILFKIGETELISRLIEGKFPEYTQIIPTSPKTTAKIPVSELVLGIKRVGIFARENNNNIRFLFEENMLHITTDATEIGSEESEIEANITGEKSEVALNGQYFLDILQNVEEENIIIELEGKLSPVLIKPETEKGLLHVIMPLKV
jgi:DNA polymerase-3 subunit beta